MSENGLESGSFGADRLPDRNAEPWIEETMGDPGRGGLESARELLFAARSGLEKAFPRSDALIDGMIQADVEVEKGASARSRARRRRG
jgi:hypothetical protein